MEREANSMRVREFQTVMFEFIEERREAKLKTAKADSVDAVNAKYEYSTWLADAARRVSQIQSVTHVLKASHPDARGTSLFLSSDHLPQHWEIGTHSQPTSIDDVVGNAAALDVYKFLKLEVQGRSLLDWLRADDPDLLAALSEDEDAAQSWSDAFKGIVRDPAELSSHQMAKQVYWCITGEPSDDSGFHLLQPMFSSSLAQVVHQEIQAARFSEANVQARQAKRDGRAFDGEYREYRNLMTRKLGGTKPQNISQLNSERGGINYLLASLPPSWDQRRPRSFLRISSAFDRFRYFEDVNALIQELISLLTSQPTPTLDTRRRRESIERQLGQALVAFGLETAQSLEPGWSRDSNCRLPLSERLWLDSGRIGLPVREQFSEVDHEFLDAFESGTWIDDIATNYASWLNRNLRERGLAVGDAEHVHWAKQAMNDAGLVLTDQALDTTTRGGHPNA